ncbi:MAG: GNAT family N-acetyltransferase [Opitutaceae bacterium]|nr:GNAT family N-acetyltransferase [Opitutaceae bacterium]
MFTLRTALPSDAAAISALTEQLGYPAPPSATLDRLERLLRHPDQLVVVACSGEQVAGWLQAHAYDVLESGLLVEIVGLVVAEPSRRAGVGRALVEQAKRWACARDAEALVVRSNTLRTQSHRFYPTLGFTASKTQAVYEIRLPRSPSA